MIPLNGYNKLINKHSSKELERKCALDQGGKHIPSSSFVLILNIVVGYEHQKLYKQFDLFTSKAHENHPEFYRLIEIVYGRAAFLHR